MTGHRGAMTRKDRQMTDGETRTFLREHGVAHVGTADADGWPYVVPLMYVYEAGDVLYLHTGTRGGHFLANVGANSKICVTVSDKGPMQPGGPSACDGSLLYKSAIVFGKVRVCDGAGLEQQKTWFFDRLLERLGDSSANYSRGYTMLQHIILYEVAIEIVTGKINVGIHH